MESDLKSVDSDGSFTTAAITKSIMGIMVPSVLNLVMSELIWQLNIYYVGRLGDEQMLGGIGLANSLVIAMVLSVTFGISGVLETMVSQAYGAN